MKPTFVFFGTADVSRKTAELLKEAGYLPSLIVTSPDRPVGRHFTMTPPEMKVWAIENDIPFIQPEKLSADSLRREGLEPDLFIVVAYGKILSQEVIDMPKIATLNIHYSLLPRWRGASPVESAILAGDTETGVSIQKMVFKLDAGDVLSESRIPIEITDTTQSLREKLIYLGVKLLVDDIFDPLSNTPKPPLKEGKPQDESQMTHAGKIKKSDGEVRPFTDDPQELWRKYRAYHGWPGIFFMHEGKRMKITGARFENGKFIIEKVIPEGKKEISWT